MKITNLILIFCVFTCPEYSGCNSTGQTNNSNNMDTIATASGLKYIVTQKGTGKQPVKGNRVTVHYTGKLTDGTKFDSSVDRGEPFSFVIGKGQVIQGWDEGIGLLHIGEKATLVIPSQLGYGSRGAGATIPPNSTLIFDVELLNIEDINIKPFDVSGKDTLKTASGLKYILLNEGTGAQPKTGQKVFVHYSGYLLDGSMFDSSVERGQPLPFTLGAGQVIKGWDEGISLLKIGGKARLIVPQELGYGERGRPPVIPPKATLVFDVELVSVE